MSDSGDTDDAVFLVNQEDFKNDLCDRISDVHSCGSFATFGIIDSCAHPGISVDPIGTMRMPLSEADARSLILASHKAPFGKGTETVTDESVRKTWQIDAPMVHFLNPRWQSCLDRTVERVARELGMADAATNVRAELYKMLLYEKGALFKRHQDTEKVPGMFATLIICLPSHHTGGAVRLQHRKKSARFDTSESSAFDTTFIAWYADVTHEIEPVQTGYRWVLVYNLINGARYQCESASTLDARIEDFAQVLAQWHDLKHVPEYLAYALDHQYTDRDLSLARLKGDDYHRARHVTQSCTVHEKFYVLLANMELHIEDPNHGGGCEKSEEISLTHVVDLEGFSLSIYGSLTIPDSCLLHDMSYDGRQPDVQRGGSYLGDHHAKIDQFFKDSVMVIVPKSFIMKFLLGNRYSRQALDKMMGQLREITTNHASMNARGMLLHFCHSSLCQNYHSGKERNLYLGPVAVTAAFLGDASLFTKAVEQTPGSFESHCYRALGELICLQGLVIREQDVVDVLTKSKKLFVIYANLNAFRNGFFRGNPSHTDQLEVKHLSRWLDTLTMNCLNDLEHTYTEDASTLVMILLEREKEPFSQFVLYQGVRVFIDAFQDDENLVNALMVELFFHLQQQRRSDKFLESLVKRIIESAISNFDLARLASYLKARSSGSFKGSLQVSRRQGEESSQAKPGEPIKAFYEYISAHKQEKVSQWLQNIQAQASGTAVEQLKDFLMSFLEELIPAVDGSSLEVQECVQSLVTTYVMGMVGREPKKPSDWARLSEVRDCDECCTDCSRMNIFLIDPELHDHILFCGDMHHVRSNFHYFLYFEVDQVNSKPVGFTKTSDWGEVDQINHNPVVVTKTLRWWEGKHQEWKIRASKARKALRNLPQAKLKQCLADRYDEIMDLRMVKVTEDASESNNQGLFATTSIVSRKRPRVN